MRRPFLLKSLVSGVLMILSGIMLPVQAQNTTTETGDKWGIKWSGFIKNDCWWDTRQVYTSREDLFLLYPLNELLDRAGEDINSGAVYNFSAMTSRLTAGFTAPDALGAKISGVVEGDFSGVTNNDINGFRLRHAYGKLTWKHAELLAGQTWHPLFTPDVAPTVASLNTGAPFQPFNRTPLISLTGIFGKFRILGAFITQRDNASDGPYGITSTYMRNAIVPNLHVQAQFKNTHHIAGLGADFKVLQTNKSYKNKVVSEPLATYAFLAWYKMNYGDFCIKLKGIYGQNLSEHLLLGGYSPTIIFSERPIERYTPSNHFFSWAQVSYGKNVQGYLFGGYAKNLGTSQANSGTYYGRGSDVAYLYRITPGVMAMFNKLQVNLETEYTVAAYGTPDINGIVRNSREIANLRVLMTVFYYF